MGRQREVAPYGEDSFSSGEHGWTWSFCLSGLLCADRPFYSPRLSSEGFSTTGQISISYKLFVTESSAWSGSPSPKTADEHLACVRRDYGSQSHWIQVTLKGQHFSLFLGVLGGQWRMVTFNLMCVQHT